MSKKERQYNHKMNSLGSEREIINQLANEKEENQRKKKLKRQEIDDEKVAKLLQKKLNEQLGFYGREAYISSEQVNVNGIKKSQNRKNPRNTQSSNQIENTQQMLKGPSRYGRKRKINQNLRDGENSSSGSSQKSNQHKQNGYKVMKRSQDDIKLSSKPTDKPKQTEPINHIEIEKSSSYDKTTPKKTDFENDQIYNKQKKALNKTDQPPNQQDYEELNLQNKQKRD